MIVCSGNDTTKQVSDSGHRVYRRVLCDRRERHRCHVVGPVWDLERAKGQDVAD
jgi:hypothetical protein